MEGNGAREVFVSDSDAVVVHRSEIGRLIEFSPELPEKQAAGRNQVGS